MSGVKNVKVYALPKKVESPNGSTIVEATVEIGGRGVAYEYLCFKHLCLYCCCVLGRRT